MVVLDIMLTVCLRDGGGPNVYCLGAWGADAVRARASTQLSGQRKLTVLGAMQYPKQHHDWLQKHIPEFRDNINAFLISDWPM